MSFLNKKIFSTESGSFGLDLSDLSVKAVQIADDGICEKVVSYGSAPIPFGSIIDGDIQKKDSVVLAIRRAIENARPEKIKTRKVVCSLPETKAFLRIVSVPQMEEQELAEAVKWEIEANIPLTLDQVYYDWQSLSCQIGAEKGKKSVIIVAVAKTVVDNTIEVLEAAGLEPVGLEIESIAQARSLVSDSLGERTTLIVDIGDRRTSFSVVKDCAPCFTSSIPLSGQSLTEAIAKQLNVSIEEAEKIKREHGIGSSFKRDVLFKAVLPVLENFATQIERSIDFYISGLQYSKNIDAIIICGGGAHTKGIVPYLTKKLGRQLDLGDPWVNVKLRGRTPLIERGESVQYSTAIGLALKGIRYGYFA